MHFETAYNIIHLFVSKSNKQWEWHAHGVCKIAMKLEDEQIVFVRLISIDNLLNFNGHLEANKKNRGLCVLHDWLAPVLCVFAHARRMSHIMTFMCY